MGAVREGSGIPSSATHSAAQVPCSNCRVQIWPRTGPGNYWDLRELALLLAGAIVWLARVKPG